MLNVHDLFRILWRHKLIIVAVVIVAAAAAAYFAFTTPPSYQAEALVRIDQRSTDIGEALVAFSVSQRLAQTYAQIVTTRALAERVATRLGGDYTRNEVLSGLSAQTVQDLDLLRIRSASEYPDRAAEMANAAAAELRAYIEEVSQEGNGERLLIVDPALAPSTPSGPSPAVILVVAVIAGLLVGAGLVLVLDYFEDRISDNEELEAITGLSILGVIPVLHPSSEGKR